MPVYQIDPMNPQVLRCRDCGAAVCALDGQDTADAPQEMTHRQAAALWPELAGLVVRHEVLCSWRQREKEAGPGAGVYLHLRDRED
jgi:hypothetical protein